MRRLHRLRRDNNGRRSCSSLETFACLCAAVGQSMHISMQSKAPCKSRAEVARQTAEAERSMELRISRIQGIGALSPRNRRRGILEYPRLLIPSRAISLRPESVVAFVTLADRMLKSTDAQIAALDSRRSGWTDHGWRGERTSASGNRRGGVYDNGSG